MVKKPLAKSPSSFRRPLPAKKAPSAKAPPAKRAPAKKQLPGMKSSPPQFHLTIRNERGRKLGVGTLASYLLLLDRIHDSIATSTFIASGLGEIVSVRDWSLETAQEEFRKMRQRPASPTPGDSRKPLAIERMTYASPLKLALSGSIASITIAVILSGGSVEISKDGLKATVPPLGQGITALREALGETPHATGSVAAATAPKARAARKIGKS